MALALYGNLLPGPRQSESALSVHVRFQIALNAPLVARCIEIARIVDEGSVKDLQVIFPQLVESIFGFNNQPGWGLKFISRIVQPRDYDALRQFLNPEGPLVRLAYKLTNDPYVSYEFPVACLPSPTRRVLEEGVIPMLYVNKIQQGPPGRLPMMLNLNAFEYLMFHLAYCLVNPFNQKAYSNWTVPAEAVYPSVVDDYLQYFLPVDGSDVPPIHLPSLSRTALPAPPACNSTMPNYSSNYAPHNNSNQLRLLRSRNPSRTPTLPPPVPEPSHMETWRTETVIEIFIEIWLTQNTLDCSNDGLMSNAQETFFPNFDHVRIVRMLVKHIHCFSNSYHSGSANSLDELKRKIVPQLIQKKLYSFLQFSIANWPLDASFRLILETWLSYIQPWRYTHVRNNRGLSPEAMEMKEKQASLAWQKFVTDNLAFYTVIFQRTLPRFFRMNLSTPKNAYMLYRVAKVFSQPDLHDMIADAECSLQEPHRMNRVPSSQSFATPGSSILATAVVTAGQQLVELERPGYHYVPLFGEEVTLQIHQLLLAVVQARHVAQAMIDLSEHENCGGLLHRFKTTFLTLFDTSTYPQSLDEYSPLDNRKVDVHLELATHHLCKLFNLEVPIVHRNGIIAREESEMSFAANQGSRNSSKTISTIFNEEENFAHLQQNKYGNKQMEITFRGNPDLQPICSYEIGILVRWLHQLASYLNGKYRLQFRNLYHRRDFIGHLCKQFLEKPVIYYEFRKNVYPPVRQQNVLPPRVSFRCIAHKQTLGYLFGGFLLAYLWWGYNPVFVLLAVVLTIVLWAVVKAAVLSVYHYKEP